MKKALLLVIVGLFCARPLLAASIYQYKGSVLGTGVKEKGNYSYEMKGQKNVFRTDEDVWVMSRLAAINGPKIFQFRDEVHLQDGRLFKRLYSPEYRPNGKYWANTYSWNKLGRIPAGNHKVKIYLSVNGGDYRLMETENLYIINAQKAVLGEKIFRTDYRYDVVSQKTEFRSDEDIYAVTKLSSLRNVRSLKVRNKIVAGNELISTAMTELTSFPESMAYVVNRFDELMPGSYTLITDVSANGDAYVRKGSQDIRVVGISNPDYYYQFDWTHIGNSVYNN